MAADSAADANCPKPTGTAQYDVMVAVVTSWGQIDTYPTGWYTIIANQFTPAGDWFCVLYTVATASEPSDYEFTCSSGLRASGIATFRNVNNSDPIGNSGYTDNGTTTTCTAPSISIVAYGEMLLHCGGSTASCTRGLPSDFSYEAFDLTSSASETAAMAYKRMTTTGATGTISATWSSWGDSIGAHVALNPL